MLPSVRFLALATTLACAAALPAAAQSGGAASAAEAAQTRGTPVNVSGLWCGAGLLRSYALDIAQESQRVQVRLTKRDRVHELTGHMDGPILHADPQRDHSMDLRLEGNELRIVAASGVLALAQGQFFTRAIGGSCTH
jgi:hypothetical protein